jgi:hypothetical protein
MIRETGDTNGNQHGDQIKRVSVRTGGAGHAHSGIVRCEAQSTKSSSVKIVKLGR